jgi:hypothetical protein
LSVAIVVSGALRRERLPCVSDGVYLSELNDKNDHGRHLALTALVQGGLSALG